MKIKRVWKRLYRKYEDVFEWLGAIVGGISVMITIYLLYMVMWFFSD